TVENGQGRLQQDNGLDGIPFVFDRYAEDRFGQVLLDTQVYPEPSAALAEVLRDAVFFGGRAVETMMGPAALYTPSPWNPGSSYSHVDEERYPASGVDGLMTPFIGAGEVIREPGPLTCALLQDLGWALAPPCANLVPDTPPLPDVFALEATGSNPFAEVTTLRVQVETPQRVQAWLFDAAGRRLGTLLDAVVEEGGARVLAVNGESLASGVYFVRVVGETFEATRAVTRLR
ncbi:MAG: T9SS type A sorting domain-containing protein, partial [Rhodothermaceae bacterium]|nr:T9SS type A sorting domain-containing protein [Rhodothermaceae bacterium]